MRSTGMCRGNHTTVFMLMRRGLGFEMNKFIKQASKKQKYTISLDIGTGSVGWAVLTEPACTSQQNQNKHGEVLAFLAKARKKVKVMDGGTALTKKKRTNLWGVRLFDSAQTAQDRRLKRRGRRRILRRTKRLKYLREIFERDIKEPDPNFFDRLSESFLVNGDEKKIYKTEKGKGPLFAGKLGDGESYSCDADFYKKYPTIYHLRQHLMETTHKVDLRLVYLALHHIIKYRGHFVNEKQSIAVEKFDIKDYLEKFINACIKLRHESDDEYEHRGSLASVGGFNKNSLLDGKLEKANDILVNKKLSKSRKVEELVGVFGKDCKDIFIAIVGNSINLEKIFSDPEYKHGNDENIPKPSDLKYSLEAEKLDDLMSKVSVVLSEAEFEILQLGKSVYSGIILSGILSKPTLSASMIDKYDLHKKQLKELKKFMRQNCSKKEYKAVFNDYDPADSKRSGIYALYIHETKSMSQEDFYKALKKILPSESMPQDILESMDMENYLPKQRYRVNGEIPFQIHEHELCKIIDNQKAHYPFLGEVHATLNDRDEYKIQTLMKFRIPYYVGPLATPEAISRKHATNAWVALKSEAANTKITPWSFDRVVDKDASNANFIERMTSFCTYLPDEKVLPKNSLIYQEFIIYNELMSCGYYIRGEGGKSKKQFFCSELKHQIMEALFKKEKNITVQKMLDFLDKEGYVPYIGKDQLFGVDKAKKGAKYNGSYSTYIDILRALKDDTHSEEQAVKTIEAHKSRFEEIIKWATIFEERDIRRRKIKLANVGEWGHFLTESQVSRLSKLKYKGWGSLSAKLLTGIKTSENKTILESLKSGTYKNFMRLLADERVEETIKKAEAEKGDIDKLDYALVESIAGSPAIKKGIWQSLQVIKELEEFLGRENIGKIVVEVSRDIGGQKGRRKKSRWQKLDALYSSFKEKTGEPIAASIRSELNDYKGNEKALDNEKLYLYFLQNGKCMYTGEPLHISSLSSYQTDHILPQTLITDNSIDNKVLVKAIENQKKDARVLDPKTIAKMIQFWGVLVKSGQMSERKLENLKRDNMTDSDIHGFINRQLVETRQITKHVANILLEHFNKDNDIEVLTPRAGLTSIFRTEFDLEKNRAINDYHHAHDAFLNGIVAIYAYKVFPELKDLWVYGNYVRKHKNMMSQNSKSVIAGMKESAWIESGSGEIIAKRDATMSMIKEVLGYRDVNIVKKTERVTGALYKETIKKKGRNKELVPMKKGYDTSWYGGKDREEAAFSIIVKNDKGEVKALPLHKPDESGYINALCKLSFLQSLYSEDKITEIVIEKLEKYTQYRLPNGGVRLLASYQEAQNGRQMKMYAPPTEKSSKDELLRIYDLLSEFIMSNRLFADVKIELLKGEMRNNFMNSESGVMLKAIEELMRITKGSNQTLKTLSDIGLGTTAQQLKSGNLISSGTTIIHRSTTGLYETQIKL